MNALRGGVLLIALAAASGLAAAQDPSVNESDFDTTAPEADESYLDDGSGDPALSEGDFDTSVPAADESYLAADAQDAGTSGGDGATASTPGFGLAAVALAALGAALLLRRR